MVLPVREPCSSCEKAYTACREVRRHYTLGKSQYAIVQRAPSRWRNTTTRTSLPLSFASVSTDNTVQSVIPETVVLLHTSNTLVTSHYAPVSTAARTLPTVYAG